MAGKGNTYRGLLTLLTDKPLQPYENKGTMSCLSGSVPPATPQGMWWTGTIPSGISPSRRRSSPVRKWVGRQASSQWDGPGSLSWMRLA